MGNMQRMAEYRDHMQSVAEDILVEVEFYERCPHHTLIAAYPDEEHKALAMRKAGDYAKASNGELDPEDVEEEIDKVIDTNTGYCASCNKDD